jgi:hypothetical protein
VQDDARRNVVQLEQGRQLDQREQSQQDQPHPRDQPLAALARLDDLTAPVAKGAAEATETETPASRERGEGSVR